MAKTKAIPHQDELAEMFRYDHETGVLYWRYRPTRSAQWNGRFAGKPAGGPSHALGYWVINLIGNNPILAHRIIWKLVYGKEPPPSIDHVDGDKGNNRLANLRAATHTDNMRNKGPHKGKVLPKGVSAARNGRFRASIYIGGRCVSLGGFDNPVDAHAAYCRAAADAFGEFARAA